MDLAIASEICSSNDKPVLTDGISLNREAAIAAAMSGSSPDWVCGESGGAASRAACVGGGGAVGITAGCDNPCKEAAIAAATSGSSLRKLDASVNRVGGDGAGRAASVGGSGVGGVNDGTEE